MRGPFPYQCIGIIPHRRPHRLFVQFAPVSISWKSLMLEPVRIVVGERAQDWRSRRWALALGPTPLDFVLGNLLGGRMLLGFEGLDFEYVGLINSSMI